MQNADNPSSHELVPLPLVEGRSRLSPHRQLEVPSDSQLSLLLAQAKQAGTLHDLRQMVAAWEAVAAKCEVAYEEFVRVAVFRLEVERDLGRELAQTVKRGGDRPKLPRGTLLRSGGLPEGVTRKQSMVYQRLAAVSEPLFREYIDSCRSRHGIPSSRGTLLHAQVASAEKPQPRVASRFPTDLELPQDAVDAVARSMDVDVLVGDAKIHAGLRLQPDAKDVFEKLRGGVFVARCQDPAKWIPRVHELQRHAAITRIALAVPARVWSPWFEELVGGAWVICFLRRRLPVDSGVLLCHLGQKPAAFRLAVKNLGPVIG